MVFSIQNGVTKEHLKSRTDLLIQVGIVRPLLNGTTLEGKKADYAPGFKIARYAIILLVGITVPLFEEYTEKVRNSMYLNFYRLDKVANFLRLDFDRSKVAPQIYGELEKNGKVRRVITEDNKTFITFTRNGEEKCKQDLQALQTLVECFHSDHGLQEKHTETEKDRDSRLSKGIYRPLTEAEQIVDKLINSISNWD